MKVSVIVTTYNHDKFIAQAINSILMQETSFNYEIIIIEDCSTDSTRDIVIAFQTGYPDKIQLVLLEKNKNDNRDFVKAIQNSQSQYIVCLDGDDYWISQHKLQAQVNYLDNRKECAICFHQAYNLYPNGSKSLYSRNFDYDSEKTVFSLEDIMFQNFLPTCSVMFRNGLIDEFPESFYTIPSPDWFLNVLNAQHGYIGYIDKIWGVRRVHPDGIISMKSPLEKLKFNIACIETINSYLKFKYTKQANIKMANYHFNIIELLLREKNFGNAKIHAKKFIKLLPIGERISKQFLIALMLSTNSAPMFYKLYKTYKRTVKGLKSTYIFPS